MGMADGVKDATVADAGDNHMNLDNLLQQFN